MTFYDLRRNAEGVTLCRRIPTSCYNALGEVSRVLGPLDLRKAMNYEIRFCRDIRL